MRIAMVSEHASPLATLGGADAGGQNVHVAALASALAEQGHAVTVHTRRDRADLPASVRTACGPVVHHVDAGPATAVPKDELLPWMGDFAAVLREQWTQRPPDVVHAHFWMSGLAAIDAARPLGIPVVQTFHALGAVKRRHQGAADTSPPERLAVEASIVRDAAHIVATCQDEAEELARLGATDGRVTVIPCGVDLERFRPDGPRWPRSERPRVTTLGRLVARKGVDDLLGALAELPSVELVVAGGPPAGALHHDPEAVRLRSIAAELGVLDRVTFAGRVARANVPGLLRSSDVVVCSPRYEPFGIVPLEAMACGVPVVATAVGGLKESVQDGVTGLLVPPSDRRELAAALGRVLADRDLRRRLGEAGAARATRRYGWPLIAEQTASVYAGLGAVSGAMSR